MVSDEIMTLRGKYAHDVGLEPTHIFMSDDQYKELYDQYKNLMREKTDENANYNKFADMTVIHSKHVTEIIPYNDSSCILMYGINKKHPVPLENLMSLMEPIPLYPLKNGKVLVMEHTISSGWLVIKAKVDGVKFRTHSFGISGVNFKNDTNIADFIRRSIAAAEAIPSGARVISPDIQDKYKGTIIAGWLFDSSYKVYGLYEGQGSSVRGFSLSTMWQPTPEELAVLTNYPNVDSEGTQHD